MARDQPAPQGPQVEKQGEAGKQCPQQRRAQGAGEPGGGDRDEHCRHRQAPQPQRRPHEAKARGE